MTEQKIEYNVVSKINDVMEAHDFGTYQVYGTLQPGVLKAREGDDDMIIVVKISPRSYQNPTTPICQIDGTVTATIRADVDYNGNTYIDVCDALVSQFEKWQKCLDDAHTDFAVAGEFEVAGFQMGSGKTSVDAENMLWQYTQEFSVFGVIQ